MSCGGPDDGLQLFTPPSRMRAGYMSDPRATLEVMPKEGSDQDGQAIEGSVVKGWKHAGVRLLKQVVQEQGRIDPREGLTVDHLVMPRTARLVRGITRLGGLANVRLRLVAYGHATRPRDSRASCGPCSLPLVGRSRCYFFVGSRRSCGHRQAFTQVLHPGRTRRSGHQGPHRREQGAWLR